MQGHVGATADTRHGMDSSNKVSRNKCSSNRYVLVFCFSRVPVFIGIYTGASACLAKAVMHIITPRA